MKIKRLLIILTVLMFCFLFNQYIVYATPPLISVQINAKYDNKQKIDNVNVSFYFTFSTFYDSDERYDKVCLLTLYTKYTNTNLCNDECHLVEYIDTNYKSGDIITCPNGCIIEKLDRDSINKIDDFTYQGNYYTHYREYTLGEDNFKEDSSALIYDVSVYTIDKVYEKYEYDISNVFSIDYNIKDNYIYLEENESDYTKGTSCILINNSIDYNYRKRKSEL